MATVWGKSLLERGLTLPFNSEVQETKKIEFVSRDAEMKPAPIPSDWILDGAPVTRNSLLSTSGDGYASTYFWDCTAGRFHWYYDTDETVCILDGSVVVRDDSGVERRLEVGDVAYFPAGSHAVWHVEAYVRKVAFFRGQLPAALLWVRRVAKEALRLAKQASPNQGAQASAFPQSSHRETPTHWPRQ